MIIDNSNAIMAITTKSSINVNALNLLIIILLSRHHDAQNRLVVLLKATSKNLICFSKRIIFDPSLTVGALCFAIFRSSLKFYFLLKTNIIIIYNGKKSKNFDIFFHYFHFLARNFARERKK